MNLLYKEKVSLEAQNVAEISSKRCCCDTHSIVRHLTLNCTAEVQYMTRKDEAAGFTGNLQTDK